MYTRKGYQDQLMRFARTPFIKVLTGLRRVGKSTILRLFQADLMAQGVAPERFVSIDMERFEFAGLRTETDLHEYVLARLPAHPSGEWSYLFIDEVQEIAQWEKAVNAFLNQGGIDIVITGSNSHLLSSELATLLTGRYVEIPVYPLTFSEFVGFGRQSGNDTPTDELFAQYLRQGGMPGLFHVDADEDLHRQVLGSLVDSVLLKDIAARYQVRDIDLLRRILLFLADNSGQTFSARRVADFLKNERRSAGIETIYNYVSYILSAFLAFRVPRYDLKGKRFLEVSEKYFFADLGLRQALVGYRPADIAPALELAVFLELKRRGYAVSVGKLQDTEVDFIAEFGGKRIYLQVCYLLSDESVVRREFGPLEAIRDNYPKLVLSMDRLAGGDQNGISWQYLPDFLLQTEP